MKKKIVNIAFVIYILILLGIYLCWFQGRADWKEKKLETKQITEEVDDDSDYKVKYIDMEQKESSKAKKYVFNAAKKCRNLYEKAAQGQECDIWLEDKIVHKMVDHLADSGYAVTCGDYDYNMMHYKKIDQCLRKAEKGRETETEFYVVNSGGIFFYQCLQFKKGELYVITASAYFDRDRNIKLNYMEKVQVYQWKYTKKGWLIWEKAKSRNQEMDMHIFYRILPISDEYRRIAETYILPINYQYNNLFLTNWDENHMDSVCFNDLYDLLYEMKTGELPDKTKYADGIPKDEFEGLIQNYFDISQKKVAGVCEV